MGRIPFSTNLAGDFPLNTHAVIIFEFNLSVLGILSVLQWNMVIASPVFLDPDTDTEEVIRCDEACIFPVLSCLAVLLALISIPWGIFIYVIAPVFILLIWWKERRIKTVRQEPAQKEI